MARSLRSRTRPDRNQECFSLRGSWGDQIQFNFPLICNRIVVSEDSVTSDADGVLRHTGVSTICLLR